MYLSYLSAPIFIKIMKISDDLIAFLFENVTSSRKFEFLIIVEFQI